MKKTNNPFEKIGGVFMDEDAVRKDGTIWCKIHKEAYEAIPTGNFCLKKYKNCPKCEVEVNYRIAKKQFKDTIFLNNMLLQSGKPMVDTPKLPDKPEWWNAGDEWHFGDSKKNNQTVTIVEFKNDDNFETENPF